jgi:AraC-like DNA-binding protein
MFAIEMVSKDDLQNGYKWCWSVVLFYVPAFTKSKQNWRHLTKAIGYSTRIQLLSRKQFKPNTKLRTTEMLNKSPKTLSNLFKKYNENRLYKLFKTAPSLKHASFTLFWQEHQRNRLRNRLKTFTSFSRFFKKAEGVSPSDLRR